jgi:hypothetical protein
MEEPSEADLARATTAVISLLDGMKLSAHL